MRLPPALLLLAPLLASAAPATLDLQPTALAPGARVRLADVATVRVPGDAAGLAAVDLAAAPLPGYTLRLSRTEIARILRARALPYVLAPEGPAAVQIERRSQGFDPARVTQVAEQALQALAALDGTRLELVLAAPLPELALPAGAVSLRVRAPAPHSLRQRRPTVWVDITVDGTFVRTVPVGFEAHAWHGVLVAARALDAGTVPACADLQVRDLDLTELAGATLDHCDAVRGRLGHALAAGAALLAGQLKQQAAVTQGDMVTLAFSDGAIVLESRATALA
ncbi:flagella basal body P-ring formation protein FlgA, partial [Massilia sp. S19_KUP03_FR1]|uniref:flagella basal body P-ring formation protein FlgA n=1 Tax=Massilia sp. S19_KUP03_FR1 TaxID=3025503 RepID=UPI002FCD847B